MNSSSTARKKPDPSLLLGAMCFMAYVVCYSGRSILSAIVPEMSAATAFTQESLGAMGSAFFICYGLGQVLNGIVGDRISTKIMVGAGLFFSGITIVAFSEIRTQGQGMFLWGLCGLLCSMLWGPLSKVVAENIPQERARKVMTGLTVASILGQMASYGIAAFAAWLNGWKLAFYIAGGVQFVGAVVWYIVLDHLEKQGFIRRVQPVRGERGAGSAVMTTLLKNAFIPMLLVSVLNGVIRNAVVFWIPTYISDYLQASPVVASSVSTLLPIVNLAGTFVGLWLYKKVKNNEYTASIVLFAVSLAMFALMALLKNGFAVLNIAALFISSAAMASMCNLEYSVYCLRFSETGYVSTITGVLNFVSYASAGYANNLFIDIAHRFSWSGTVLCWVLLAAGGLLMSLLSLLSARKNGTVAQK